MILNYLSDIINKLKEIVLDMFYPKKCIMCNKLVSIGKSYAVCKECEKTIGSKNLFLIEPDSFFDEALCCVKYASYAKDSMMRFKFKDKEYLAKSYAYLIYKSVVNKGFIEDNMIMCPVPMHHKRDRDYNQSELICNHLSKMLNLKIYSDMLIKIQNLSPLSKMGYSLRSASIKGAIDFNVKYDIVGKDIVLIDDIYTSGSSVNECSKILKMHGAKSVLVLCALYSEWEDDEGGTTD